MRDSDQIVKLWLFLKIQLMMEVKIVFLQGKIVEIEMTMAQLKKMKSIRQKVFIL